MLQDQAAFAMGLSSAYAAGALSPAFALLAQAQAAVRPGASASLAVAEIVAGAALDRETPVALRPEALERVLALASTLPQAAPEDEEEGPDPEWAALPAAVRLQARAALKKNRFSGFGGVQSLDLAMDDDLKVELLRIEPGKGAPRHTHGGAELTLVLTGAFSDGYGRYAPGDIAVVGPEHTHRPIAEPGAVCFALAISEAPLRFTGPLGFVQRLVKF